MKDILLKYNKVMQVSVGKCNFKTFRVHLKLEDTPFRVKSYIIPHVYIYTLDI